MHAPYQPHPLDVRLHQLLWKYTLTHTTIEPTSAPYGKAREVRVCGARWFRKELNKNSWKESAFSKIQVACGLFVTPATVLVKQGPNAGMYSCATEGVDLSCLMLHATLGNEVLLDNLCCEDLRAIALLDVFCGNYRHASNIIVTPDGRVRAIDHEFAFSGKASKSEESNNGKLGKVDGPILGRTMKSRHRFTWLEVIDQCNLRQQFDYEARCGPSGTEFSAQFKQVLTQFATTISGKWKPTEMRTKYHICADHMFACALRAKCMLDFGVEATVSHMVKWRDTKYMGKEPRKVPTLEEPNTDLQEIINRHRHLCTSGVLQED